MQYIFKFFGVTFAILSIGFVGLALFNTISPKNKPSLATPNPSSQSSDDVELAKSQLKQKFQSMKAVQHHEPLPYASPAQLQTLNSINSESDYRSRQNRENKRKLEVLKSFKKTCNYWTKEFNKSRSERSRLFMNSSCRDAENYARKELNHRSKNPNYAAHQPRNSSRARAISLNNDTKGKSTSGQCSRWERELDNINMRLNHKYKEPTGNRLRKRRHELNSILRKQC